MKQLELRLSRVPQSTEIGYRWANNLKDKEENLDMVKNCIINGKFETIGSDPSNMVWEDVVDVAALYQAAKQAGLEMDFISAIQNDIKKIRMSNAPDYVWNIVTPRKAIPKDLDATKFPTTPKRVADASRALARRTMESNNVRNVGSGERWPVEDWDDPML